MVKLGFIYVEVQVRILPYARDKHFDILFIYFIYIYLNRIYYLTVFLQCAEYTTTPENRNLISGIFVLEHYADLLPEFMSLTFFIEVFVQTHVDEVSDVHRCFQMHHLLGRCINLVWSSISELHRQSEIFDHQHVPHLRLPCN